MKELFGKIVNAIDAKVIIIFVGLIVVIVQALQIREYRKSEEEWVKLSVMWREKLDTCMERNARIYEQLDEFKDIRIKQLKGELPK